MDLGILSTAIGLASMAGNVLQTASANKSAKQQAQAQNAYLNQQQISAEKERQNLLKAQLAKQRAVFAGSGINPDEGSADAVLGKIENEAKEDLNEIRDDYRYKINRVNNSLATNQRKNLLSTTNGLLRKTAGMLN